MTTAKLLLLRVVAPGSIALVYTVPFWLEYQNITAKIPEFVVALAPLAIGGAYYAFGVRNWVWGKFLKDCDMHIKRSLCDALDHLPSLRLAAQALPAKEVMNIFYSLIDADKSLVERGNRVRMNGGILSTIIDARLLLLLFCILYLVASGVFRDAGFARLAVYSCVLILVLLLMEGRVRKKHLRLESEQLGYIKQLRRVELAGLVEKTIQYKSQEGRPSS